MVPSFLTIQIENTCPVFTLFSLFSNSSDRGFLRTELSVRASCLFSFLFFSFPFFLNIDINVGLMDLTSNPDPASVLILSTVPGLRNCPKRHRRCGELRVLFFRHKNLKVILT